MTVNCPKCETDISDSYQDDEPDVGVVGGWYCDARDVGYGENELGGDSSDFDVVPAQPDLGASYGTPVSELSGRPGHQGFAEFCRIASSWGHD